MSAKVIPIQPQLPEAVKPASSIPSLTVSPPPKPEASGHRERLKEKFAAGQGTGLADYELLELALTYAIPRKDVKPLAKSLLAAYGDLTGVLAAPAADLQNHAGLGTSSAIFLQLVGSLARRVGRSALGKKPVLANKLALYDYLYTLFADKTREEVHVLYLDTQHQLLTDETLFLGTLTQSAASPRDILKRALAYNAGGLIIAHNHPSGIPTPSPADVEFTTALQTACASLSLTLHDHLIVGTGQIFSFKSANRL